MSEIKEAAGFRVGDEVEILKNRVIARVGYVQMIEYIKSSSRKDCKFSFNGFYRGLGEHEIRHTRALANPLNRKLYPNRIEINGYLYRREVAERLNK